MARNNPLLPANLQHKESRNPIPKKAGTNTHRLLPRAAHQVLDDMPQKPISTIIPIACSTNFTQAIPG